MAIDKKAGELIVGDRVFMGARGVRLTKVTHLQMWTELFTISFDRDQAVEGFIAPLVGMQTKGAASCAEERQQQPDWSVFTPLDLSRYSEEDLRRAAPLLYED